MSGKNGTGTVIPFRGAVAAAGVNSAPDEATARLLRRLRELWRRTQLTGRGDFDRACLLLTGDQTTTVERYASAFFHGAQIFGRRRLTFYTARANAFSDDEMWLARLLLALSGEDHTSARYLMALRIEPEGVRRLMFLAQGLASQLCSASPASGGDAK